MSERPQVPAKVGSPYGFYVADSRNLDNLIGEQFDEECPIDVTITSPPYADKKNYEADEDAQIGFGQSYDAYLEELRNVFRQVYDRTAETGTLWVVVNTIKRDQRVVRLPFDIADVCENLHAIDTCDACNARLTKERESGELLCGECGERYDPLDESWRLQDIVIWDKKRARPWSREGQLRNVFEYILCFSKSESGFQFDLDSIRVADTADFEDWWVKYPERYNPRGKVPNNIWQFTTPTQGSWGGGDIDHPAPFPTGMVDRMINLTTTPGDVVFDPFAGTANVLARAEAMGRLPLGIDLSTEYAKMYERRLDEMSEVADDSSLQQKQGQLETVICKLRQLKYPRELTRRIRHETDFETLAEMQINTMIQLSHEVIDRDKFDDDHLLMEDDLYVVLDDGVTDEHRMLIAEVAEKCANEPPCSKFGVKTNLNVITVSEMKQEFTERWEWPQRLNLYDNDTYYSTSERMTLTEWVSAASSEKAWRDKRAENEYPPILSNLHSDVPDPRSVEGAVSLDDVLSNGGEKDTSDEETTTLLDF